MKKNCGFCDEKVVVLWIIMNGSRGKYCGLIGTMQFFYAVLRF